MTELALNINQLIDDAGSTASDLEASELDGLITAINSVKTLISVMGRSSGAGLLSILVEPFQRCQLDDDALAKIMVELEGLPENEVASFLEQCKLAPPAPKFKPRSMRDLLAMPPKEWVIDQVIGKGDIAMVYGAPGCGKTFVVIDMIFSACLGQTWAMRFALERRLNVAYCAGEGISGLPSRFAAAAEFYQQDNIPNFTFYDMTPQLYTGEDASVISSITNFVNEWKQRQEDGQAQPLDILIIDTLHSATAGADENSAKDMGMVLKLAKEAGQALGCAVLLVHHTNKNGTAERGSSALRGAMDCMIEIKRISETGTKAVMHCAKLKDGEAWKDQTLDLIESGESVRVWWDLPSETGQTGKGAEAKAAMLAFLKSQPGTKLTAKMLAEVAGINQSQAIKLLAKLVQDGECIAELQDTSKPNGNRNPLTYQVKKP